MYSCIVINHAKCECVLKFHFAGPFPGNFNSYGLFLRYSKWHTINWAGINVEPFVRVWKKVLNDESSTNLNWHEIFFFGANKVPSVLT